jgi:lipoate-protein ligase B
MIGEALKRSHILLEDWGLLDYQSAFARQEEMVVERQNKLRADTLVLVEHPPVVTLGRRGSNDDLRKEVDAPEFSGVDLQFINRGGLATAHEPGQMVVYPVVELKKKDLRWYADTFLAVVVDLLADYGLSGELKQGEPGVWVNQRKICSFGIAVKKWVTSHGIALNVNNDLTTFDLIVPCGRPLENVTSVAAELGQQVEMARLKKQFVEHFLAAFAYQTNP